MCLLAPPKKPKKAPKPAKTPPKPASIPAIPRYSRMPPRPCCAPVFPRVHQVDDLVSFLHQHYPDDRAVLEQYSAQLDLHRLDDVVHTHAEQNQKATETVGAGVKDIQDRLGKMEETQKGTEEAAKAVRGICEDEKERRAGKIEARREQREDAAAREIERLEGLVDKGKKEGETKGLDQSAVLKLLEDRDMRLELQRWKTLWAEQQTENKKEPAEGVITEPKLRKILDEREQLKESRHLRAQDDKPHKDCLEHMDLFEILDQRDHEREFTRLRELETAEPSSTKQEKESSEDDRLRKILEVHEQHRELERLRVFEADTLKREAKDSSKPDSGPPASFQDVEQLVEDILDKRDRKHDRGGRERANQSRSGVENCHSAIDEILALLLHRQPVNDAASMLENLLHRAEGADLRDPQGSDRQWILTEALRYLDIYLLSCQRETDRYENADASYHQSHHARGGTCGYCSCGTIHPPLPPTFHPHLPPHGRTHEASTAPPSYRSPGRPSHPDGAKARRWSPSRVRVHEPKPTPGYWERAPQYNYEHKQR